MGLRKRKTDSPIARTWKLQDAKNCFSELVETARRDGPQTVTKHGQPAVVVLAEELFRAMVGNKNETSFAEFIRRSPLRGTRLDLDRAEENLASRTEDLFE